MTRRELTALCISVALVPLNSTMLAAALPGIGRDLQASPPVLTLWLVTSYLLVALAFQTPAGKLSDALGHARALVIGQTIFAGASSVGYASHSIYLLVAARLLMAAGGALMVPSAMAMIRAHVPEASRASAFGTLTAAVGIASAMGPLLGGELAFRFGWSSLFLVNVPLVGTAFALRGRRPSVAPSKMPPFDAVGAILLAVGLALLVFSVRPVSHRLAYAAGGLVLLGGFGVWERRTSEPLVDFGLFSQRPFLVGTLVIAFQNLAVYALIFELPIVLARALGYGANEAGRTLLALTLATAAFSVIGGRLTRRVGQRGVAVAGGAVAVLGAALLGVLPLTYAKVGLVLLGTGSGLATPAAQAAALSAISSEKSGMAVGVGTTMRYLGGVVGMAVVTGLLEGGELLARYRLGIIFFSAALLTATVCATMLHPRPRSQP